MSLFPIAIIGTTTWGTTLGLMLARKGEVRLWARTEEEARELQQRRESPFLSGYPFPPTLTATSSLAQALEGVGLLILAVPAQSMRANVHPLGEYAREGLPILSTAKGLETETGLRMSQVIAQELFQQNPQIAVLSGPNIAKEILRGLPAASVVASPEVEVAKGVGEVLHTPRFQVELSRDVIGVELGGALKNVIALGMGMVEGLGYGDNAKAALLTQGLGEMVNLGLALGAQRETFFGLAGLGDLIVTCFSPFSRNHYVGVELGKGRPLGEITASMREVAEGVSTTLAVGKLSRRLKVKLPITQAVYRVLFEGLAPEEALGQVLSSPSLSRK